MEKVSKLSVDDFLKIGFFALWPLIDFYRVNEDSFYLKPLIITWFLALSFSVTILVVATKIAGKKWPSFEPRRLADILSLAVALFFSFSLFRGVNNGVIRLAVWLLILCVIALIVWRLSIRKAFSRILFIASIGLVVFSVLALRINPLGLSRFSTDGVASDPLNYWPGALVRHPNIYYFIFDMYARADTIKKATGYENSGFLKKLQTRGFYVADRSHSNYPVTFHSIPSTLGAKYLFDKTGMNQYNSRSFMSIYQGNNFVTRVLKKAGYVYLHFNNALCTQSECRGYEDVCINNVEYVLSGHSESIIGLTPLSLFWNRIKGWRSPYPGSGLPLIVTEMDKQRVREARPLFLFAHVMVPHTPAKYNNDCSRRKNAESSDNQDTYANDVRCLNQIILESVDKILKKDPNAIIFMHGDHGTNFLDQFQTPIAEWSQEQIQERFSIFNAYHLPEDCMSMLYSSISPVNNLRVLAACLSKTKPKLLPDRYFITSYEQNPNYGDVLEININ